MLKLKWVHVYGLLILGLGGVGACGPAPISSKLQDESVALLRQRVQNPAYWNEFDANFRADRSIWLKHFAKTAAQCIGRRDRLHGAYTLFHGCYDWHSAVHAHWAAFAVANALPEDREAQELARQVARRFSAAQFETVNSELKREPEFENPYGRAWLLRLAIVYTPWRSRQTDSYPDIEPLANATANDLVASLRHARRSDLEDSQYQNTAWALAQLISYQSAAPEFSENLDHLLGPPEQLADLYFEPARDHHPQAFFSPFWSAVYLAALRGKLRGTKFGIPVARFTDEALTPVNIPEGSGEVHHFGMNWSKAWAIAGLRDLLGDEHQYHQELDRAYNAHIKVGLREHFRRLGDYYSYDHWVPQFAIYGLLAP